MAFGFRASCSDCGHEWEGLCREFECGRVDFREPGSYRRHACPKCFAQLCVPREMSRSTFLRWVHENASELTRSPLSFTACQEGVMVNLESLAVIGRSRFLLGACERVAGVLAGASSPYAAIPIEMGTITCTDCHEPMLDGGIESNLLVCRHCQNRSASLVGERYLEKVLVAYRPLDDDVAQGVIFYLCRLAEFSRRSLGKRKLALAGARDPNDTVEKAVDPLWDHELDWECHDFTHLSS
jgi:hypothetical protein